MNESPGLCICTAHYAHIMSVGHEWRTHKDAEPYFWDCRGDSNENWKNSFLIFQSTVSGEGIVEINGKSFRQTAGSAFMIERPGPYRYWLPDDSEMWELKFLNISSNAELIWNGITQSFGRNFTIKKEDEAMVLLDKIFDRIKHKKINNIFDNSLYTYRFLLALHKQLARINERSPGADAVKKCISFIDDNFSRK